MSEFGNEGNKWFIKNRGIYVIVEIKNRTLKWYHFAASTRKLRKERFIAVIKPGP